MVEVSETIQTSPDKVFAVLSDGWLYASWVVGASHIREVDAGWPAPGTRIHHSVGPWPFQVHDITAVAVSEPPRILELDARLWLFGKARIRLELTEKSPGQTEVRMFEQITEGPAHLMPHAAQATLLVPRNRESLRRLARLSEGRDQ